MHFFNVNAVARELKANKISEHEKVKYFFGLSLIEALAYGGSNILIWLLGILIFIGGFYFAYRANKQGDNKNFIERYICLSFPIAILFLITSIAIGFALILFILFLTGMSRGVEPVLEVFYFFVPVLYILAVITLVIKIKEVARG